MKTRQLLVLIPMAVGLTACQTHPTPPKSFTLGTVQAEALGAQHRVVYSIPKYRPGNQTTGTQNNTFTESYSAFCAEPSPDAMNALASSLGLNLQAEDKLKLGMSVAQNISATNIGLRTAAIQTLRDITYRNCEGFANGGISPIGLETLQRRFQSTMVSILAIEQLTGAVTPPTVALTGKAEAMDTADYATLASLVDKKETEVTALKAARDKANTDYEDEKKKDNNKDKTDSAEKALKQAQEKLDTGQAELDSLKTAMTKLTPSSHATSQTLAANIGNGGGSRVSDATMEKLAATVQQITKDTLVLGFGRELCTSILGRSVDQLDQNAVMGLEHQINQLSAVSKLTEKETARLKKEKGDGYKTEEDTLIKLLKGRHDSLQTQILNGTGFINPVTLTCIDLLKEDISTAQANVNNANLYATKYWETMNSLVSKLGNKMSSQEFAIALSALNGAKPPAPETPAFIETSTAADKEAKGKKKAGGKKKPATETTPLPATAKPIAAPDATKTNDGTNGNGPKPQPVLEPLTKKPVVR